MTATTCGGGATMTATAHGEERRLLMGEDGEMAVRCKCEDR